MATNAPMPRMVPTIVSADRPGRWSSPASASLPRSWGRNRDGSARVRPLLALGARIAISVASRERGIVHLLFEPAVADDDPALGPRGDRRVVGDDQERGAGPVQRLEQFGQL